MGEGSAFCLLRCCTFLSVILQGHGRLREGARSPGDLHGPLSGDAAGFL